MQIVNPSGRRGATGAQATAGPKRSLRGARIAVLDNGKPNADHVMAAAARSLQEHSGVAGFDHFTKPVAARPCPEDVLIRFRGFDAAIVGVGD